MSVPTDILQHAVAILKAGGLVGMPTETVYGLAADAAQPAAVAKVFAAKGRPADHPLIVHVATPAALTDWARDIPSVAYRLAEAFWPGPLTLILKKQPWVPMEVTGGQETVGLRVPGHPVATALLTAFGGGLAAPSANRFGRISPTTAEAVREELGDAVECVLDGGACEGGIESTIVDCTGEMPTMLRPGLISRARLEAVLHAPIQTGRQQAPRVSGSHAMHYAPETETRLFSSTDLQAALSSCEKEMLPIAVLLCESTPLPASVPIHYVKMPVTAAGYAHDLYQTLRSLDQGGFRSIWIESVPKGTEWDAIRDRLKRATAR